MPKRDFLAIPDFSADELNRLFDVAARMKDGSDTKTSRWPDARWA